MSSLWSEENGAEKKTSIRFTFRNLIQKVEIFRHRIIIIFVFIVIDLSSKFSDHNRNTVTSHFPGFIIDIIGKEFDGHLLFEFAFWYFGHDNMLGIVVGGCGVVCVL